MSFLSPRLYQFSLDRSSTYFVLLHAFFKTVVSRLPTPRRIRHPSSASV
jgi:hypothetical protein